MKITFDVQIVIHMTSHLFSPLYFMCSRLNPSDYVTLHSLVETIQFLFSIEMRLHFFFHSFSLEMRFIVHVKQIHLQMWSEQKKREKKNEIRLNFIDSHR